MATRSTTRLGTAPKEGIKGPVAIDTLTNITLSGLQTIRNYAVQSGDRVLVRNQTDPTENGIYDAYVGAWTRAKDWNNADDVVSGALIVSSGSNTLYRADFDGEWSAGSTSVVFTSSINDWDNSVITTNSETVTLTSGQTVVNFVNTTTTQSSIYLFGLNVDNGQLLLNTDYTVDSETQITLTESYPAGSVIRVVQNVGTQDPVSNIEVFDNIAQMKAASLAIGQIALCKRYYAGGPLVDGLVFEIVASNTGTDDGGSFHDLSNNFQAKLIISGTVSAKQFGARGDGTTDDHLPLNSLMSSSFEHISGDGNLYLISQPLTATTEKYISELNLKASSILTGLLETTGALSYKNSVLDGNFLAEVGVRSREDSLYENVEIKNIQSSSTNGAYGIHGTLTAKTKGRVVLNNVKINGVTHTVTTGLIGDNEGASRGVRIKYFGACDLCTTSLTNITCLDIFGQEGDCVVVADENDTTNSSFFLSGLHLEGFNRRGVKIQADNVTINGISRCKDVDGQDVRAINGEAAIDTAGTNFENIQIENVSIECLSLSQAVRIADTVGNCRANNFQIKVNATGSATPEVLLQNNNDNFQASGWTVDTNHFICISDAGNQTGDYCKITDWQVNCTNVNSLSFINMSGDAYNHDISNITLTGNQENVIANTNHGITNWFVSDVKVFASSGKGRWWSNSTGSLFGVVFQNMYSTGTNVPFNDVTNLSGATLTGATRRNNLHSTTSSGFRQNINDIPISVYPQTTIANPSGGSTVDTEARTAINTLINRLQANQTIL